LSYRKPSTSLESSSKTTFLSSKELLASWGPEIDEVVSQVSDLECWVSGSLEWSLSCHRYFGDSLEEVRRTRRISLAEKVA